MTQYEIRVETPWPAERAFDYLIDLSNFDEWDPGTKSARALDDGPPRTGSRFDLEVGRTTLRYELTEVDRPRRFVARAESRFLASEDTIEVEARGEGAIVTYVADLTLNGLLRIGDPLLALLFRRMGDKAADGLAAKLEGVRVS